MASSPKGFFITGTDTGVGKTVVTAALSYNLKQSGKSVAVMKPVQTGTNTTEFLDIEFVNKVIDADPPIDSVCPYRFPDPVAPLLASKLVGQAIEIVRLISGFQSLSKDHEIVLVEGAGGLLVPITKDYFMSDLAFELEIPIIIVTSPILGSLNHTLLTVEVARARGLKIEGIIINKFPDDPGLAERTNPELMLKLARVPILGVLYFDHDISVEEGRVGRLREIAISSFTHELEGCLIVEEFLNKLKYPIS